MFEKMKKQTAVVRRAAAGILAGAMCVSALAACGNPAANGNADSKNIDTLKVAFVPSKDPQEIITATEPLKNLLKEQLGKEGYTVNNVDITVGSSYEAVGESLSAGTVDVGLIPGGTYVLYDDDVDVLLTATRGGLNVDSDNPKDWNDAAPIKKDDTKQTTSYRGLIIAGPSAKGQELAKKVNSGEKLTWDDIKDANWSVMGASSPAGYIYPALWLKDNFDGKSITDLTHAAQSDSYGSAFARLAQGQFDVLATYADARMDYEQKWTTDFGRPNDIWKDTAVIGVTPAIYNDTVSVSKNSKIMSDEFKKALSDAFIAIAKTDEGKKVIAVYTHEGYQPAKSSDYDNERQAQELVKQLKK
ncbi:phosphonate ABC transporter substrate-binding protein [Bifidobacterium sp. DSM 109958]|uniref:Phosphonate ABC transporter substrate-binding protein n=1 Tax=Bifidobacterium moraviense TaxID=2675323 RepID=A0A7Y0F389_9BIFI|nr:PhnD/SsuA/transferrin family substrate-binding protein [Bifidobacterium sp. DSM 109958]NMN01198.1 phosphonate ABC transporter substrate-binding protein [Bifidobacterium sp. DSM 109958]